MYHPIKCGWKKIKTSADMVETAILDYTSPHCNPEPEDSKPIFLPDTLAHDDASSQQVWLQKVQQLRRYRPDEHSLEFWTFSATLSLTETEQSNLFTRQSNQRWCTSKPNFVAKGSAVQKIYQNVMFLKSDPSLWPWPWRQQTTWPWRQQITWPWRQRINLFGR